jgi:peptide/nickel transport system permease protein
MSAARLLERLIQLVFVLFGISVIVFVMMELTPGDPVEIILGDASAPPEVIARMRQEFGLDLPVHQRFIMFIGQLLTGNLGRSYVHGTPVAAMILERLPATIELTLVAMLVALAVSIPLGVVAAVYRGGIIDRLASIGAMLGISLPGFWFGILLILLLSVNLHILPVSGRIGFGLDVPTVTGLLLVDTLLAGKPASFLDALSHLVMPALTLGLGMTAILMRVTRGAMLEALSQDYMTFAEAKGLKRLRILVRHGLKNALIPTVTVAAIETGSLLGGNMIVETIFSWPGLGRFVVDSIFSRDYPVVQACVLLYAGTYVVLNFVADMLYTWLDPRVRL